MKRKTKILKIIFDSVGSFMKFCIEKNLKIERDETSGNHGAIYFTDKSYAEFNYTEGFVSSNGTGYSDSLEIVYFPFLSDKIAKST